MKLLNRFFKRAIEDELRLMDFGPRMQGNNMYDYKERFFLHSEIARLRCLAKLQAGANIGFIAILIILVVKVL